MSELRRALSGAVGQRFHAAVISVTAAVEDDLRHPGFLRARGESLADFRGAGGLRSLDAAVGDGEERAAPSIVHELRRDVLHRAEHHEAWPIRRAEQLLQHAKLATDAPLLLCLQTTY